METRACRAGKLELLAHDEVWLSFTDVGLLRLADLLWLLPDKPSIAAHKKLVLDLSHVPIAYPSFVAVVGSWARSLALDPALRHVDIAYARPADARVAEWVQGIGFLEAVSARPIPGARSGLTVALSEIAPNDPNAPANTAARIMAMIDSSELRLSPDAHHSTDEAIGEVVENTIRHAGLTSPAFAAAQVHPHTHKLSLCIADTGIGIEESFRTGPYDLARDRLARGDDPLELAIEPLMSSKFGSGHSGYGLFYTSELCRQAHGTFVLSSGSKSLVLFKDGKKYETHRPWQGTVVNVLLDTRYPIDGKAVWESLPPASGDEEYVTVFATNGPDYAVVMLADRGARLYTRESAKKALAPILKRNDEPIIVSLSGVVSLTPSYADEFFTGLLRARGLERFRSSVVVVGASKYQRMLIELVVRNALRTTRSG